MCKLRNRGKQVLLQVLIALAMIPALTFAGFDLSANDHSGSMRTLDQEEQQTVSLFQSAAPSVVNVDTTDKVIVRRGNSAMVDEIPSGSGSGFIWDQQGHVVTNYHVIRMADRSQVTLSDGSVWPAKLIGSAADFDLAVLKINAPKNRLAPLAIGTSSDLLVGQKVFAIGNPFGLDQTLTTGIISGLGRQMRAESGEPIDDVIQTDAAINPGNSGGPLLDNQGNLIGVNTAIVSPAGASAGVGFAVPVDSVRMVVPEIISKGTFQRPRLGVTLASEEIADRFGKQGLMVLQVTPGSPADRAGIRPTTIDDEENVKPGDFILSINGTKLDSSTRLLNELRRLRTGDLVKLEVMRDDHVERIEVRL